MKSISIIGTVGIPASYGGFETLAENLVYFHQSHSIDGNLTVYCSANSYKVKLNNFHGANLRYIKLKANGIYSVAYDIFSILSAVLHGSNIILLLGVSGAISLPFIRLFSRSRIVTNIDGVEWKREKWKRIARWFLHFSEWLAVRFSHEVVADNPGIASYIQQSYGRNVHVIAYGGDHALKNPSKIYFGPTLPINYAFALCRIEPENNVDLILEAFSLNMKMPLVFVGNWSNSTFSSKLRQRYADNPNLYLLDPIYDLGVLRKLREDAAIYVHGHSAGGTNPSLVEMMHFGIPILAYDCIFNRCTTKDGAIFFKDVESLRSGVTNLDSTDARIIGSNMHRIANEFYRWNLIGDAYFKLLLGKSFANGS